MALGGDQGGSIRIPSSSCGIVGLKPTKGLVPYTGILPIEFTLDHVGPMARTVHDTALLLEVSYQKIFLYTVLLQPLRQTYFTPVRERFEPGYEVSNCLDLIIIYICKISLKKAYNGFPTFVSRKEESSISKLFFICGIVNIRASCNLPIIL